MPAVPLLSGILGTGQAEFATSYPLNLEPVAIDNKLAKGQLRATSGCVPLGTGPGVDRGGITWNGQHYRVMGTKLVKVAADGTVTTIGEVGGTGPVSMAYSFDRLGIRSGTALFYYDGMTLTEVTDEDLGPVNDMVWFKSHFVTTDGTYIVATELSDPTSVIPLKYGSAESDPDPVTGVAAISDEEMLAVGRHTIQPLRYVGGNGFPMTPVPGATIPYGCVSASAKTRFAASLAFVGSARGEGLRVFIAGQGDASPISTRAVEDALAAVEDETGIILEARSWRGEQRLFVHLPGETWVYCAEASQAVQQAVWYRAGSGRGEPYRIRGAVPAYGSIVAGDLNSAAVGTLSDDVCTHFGELAEWQFDCGLIDGPAIIHSVELKGLPGRGADGTMYMSITLDGETFGAETAISMGAPGARTRRMQWRPHRRVPNYAGLRFRGLSAAMPGFARCDVEAEPLRA